MYFLLFYYYLLHSCQKAELCLSGWWDQSACCWETFKAVYKILVESLRKIPAAAKYSWNVERVNTFMEQSWSGVQCQTWILYVCMIRSTTQYEHEQQPDKLLLSIIEVSGRKLLEPAAVIANQDGIQFNNAQSEVAPLSVQN